METFGAMAGGSCNPDDDREYVMVDAVSSLVPGSAGGTSVAVEAAAEQGAFPAAMEQALAEPPGADSGKTLPKNDGGSLPVAAVVAAPPVLSPAALVTQNPPVQTEASVAELPIAAAQAAVVNVLQQVAEGQRALPKAASVASTLDDSLTQAEETGLSAEQLDVAGALATATPAEATSPAAGAPLAPVIAVAAPVITVSTLVTTNATPADEAAQAASVAIATDVPVRGAKSTRRLPGAPDASASPATMVGQAAMAVQPQPRQAPFAVTAARPGGAALTSTVSGTTATPGKTADPTGAPASTAANAQAQVASAEFVFVPSAAGSEAGSEAGSAQAASLLGAALGTASATLLPAMAGTPEPVELPLAARPGSSGFSSELGERLVWLVNQGVQEARLQLNPRELGPIEVRLGFSDGAAQVSFSVQHAGTAAAVQQSLPQLRELLAQQGLQLGEAGVFQRNADTAANADQAGQQAARQAWVDRGGAFDEGDDLPPISPAHVIGRGLVDAYA